MVWCRRYHHIKSWISISAFLARIIVIVDAEDYLAFSILHDPIYNRLVRYAAHTDVKSMLPSKQLIQTDGIYCPLADVYSIRIFARHKIPKSVWCRSTAADYLPTVAKLIIRCPHLERSFIIVDKNDMIAPFLIDQPLFQQKTNCIPRYLTFIAKVLVYREIFGCDTGYLLCEYDERVRYQQDVRDITGLSGVATLRLQDWHKKSEDLVGIISYLLESRDFLPLLFKIKRLCSLAEEFDQKRTKFRPAKDVAAESDMITATKYSAAEIFSRMLNEIYDEYDHEKKDYKEILARLRGE